MSATQTRLARSEAVTLAWELLALLSPYCERIEVLGSIRRQRSTCGDIELLAIPKMEPSMLHDMFGDAVSHVPAIDMLDNALQDLLAEGTLQQRQPRKWGPRYRAALYRAFPLDLFVCLAPAKWGVLSVLRTGPAEFSRQIVTPIEKGGLMPKGMYCYGGAIWRDGDSLDTPEEIDVFRALNLRYLEPELRERPT